MYTKIEATLSEFRAQMHQSLAAGTRVDKNKKTSDQQYDSRPECGSVTVTFMRPIMFYHSQFKHFAIRKIHLWHHNLLLMREREIVKDIIRDVLKRHQDTITSSKATNLAVMWDSFFLLLNSLTLNTLGRGGTLSEGNPTERSKGFETIIF
jgi:hypothetical protein